MKDSKVLNLVLCSAVAVLALASAVLSYFLFDQREELAKNGEKRTESIQSLAKISGVPAKGNAEDMLNAIRNKSNATNAQNSEMAQKLHDIGRITNAGTGNIESFKNAGSSSEQIKKTLEAVEKLVKDCDKLKEAKKENEGLKKTIENQKVTIKDLEERPTEADVDNRIETAKKTATAAAARENSRLKAEISELKNKNRKLASDMETITGGKNANVSPWKDGSAEARRQLSGTVTKVSDDYGYIVIDLGSTSVVSQKIGTLDHKAKLNLGKGMELVVIRDKQFIASISLYDVGEKESTALIPVEKAGMIKVGDKVIWSTK